MMLKKRSTHDKPKECLKAYWLGAHEMGARALNVPKLPHEGSLEF
jgi:hypothetical protein